MRGRHLIAAGSLLVLVAIVVGALLLVRPSDDRTHLTVDFSRTVSLYEGADVRILGVKVGDVDSVEPRGETVRVELSWDAEYKVPAGAKAVIVSPSIVGDRYIQLTPAYESGPTIEDGAHLDSSETAVPVELDEVYKSLDQLATALGPRGANKNGALDRLLSTSADALDGQGKKFHRMLKDLSKLTKTLDDNKDELFGSMTQLERFVRALADNDAVVRRFNNSLSEVSSMLAGEREDLAGALRALGSSLDEVRTYVRDNRGALKKNVKALVDVTDQLVDQRKNLAKIMNTAPTALVNQVLTYNPSIGALDNRTSILNPDPSRPNLGFGPADFNLTNTLVAPDNPGPWAGAKFAFCALLSNRGFAGASDDCKDAFPAEFFTKLATRGLGGQAPAASEDQLDALRSGSDQTALASLLAVRQ